MKIRRNYRNLSENELIKKAKKNAKENIKEFTGLSYLSVFKSIYDLVKTPVPFESAKLLSGFGLGVGGSGNVCGALSGGIAAIGLVYGETEPTYNGDRFSEIVKKEGMAQEEKKEELKSLIRHGAIYNRLVNKFEEKFGSSQCSELIDEWKENPICVKRYKNCHKIIIETAGMVMELLLKAENEGLDSFDFGKMVYDKLCTPEF